MLPELFELAPGCALSVVAEPVAGRVLPGIAVPGAAPTPGEPG
jgi:hypothetical protein